MAKNIIGLKFGNNEYVTRPYGTCSTAAGTAAKVVECADFALITGATILVKFSAANSASSPTLNVNSTGAKNIYYRGAALKSSLFYWSAGDIVEFYYDGTQWNLIDVGNSNTTYSQASLGQGYGTCATDAATTIKTVTLSNYALVTNGIVSVKFTNAVGASSTMNINSKGEKAIHYKGTAITAGVIPAGAIATFIYDGTQYQLIGVDVPRVSVSRNLTSGTKVGTITIDGSATDLYCQTNSDTKNTAGSTDSSSKLFLIGATSQAANPQTYSHDTAYVGTDGCLYSNNTKVLTAHQTIKQDGVTGATVNRYASCSTAAGTVAKTANVTSGTFSLEAGARVTVKFANANTANSPTLNINSTGAKAIYHKGAAISSGGNKALLAGIVDFVYDGTQYHLVGNYIDTNTTYTLPAATTGALGGVKSGGDVTVGSDGIMSVVDDSHNHVISNIDNLQTTLDAKAPLASPAFTGNPTAPTQTAGNNSTRIATTAFVQTAITGLNAQLIAAEGSADDPDSTEGQITVHNTDSNTNYKMVFHSGNTAYSTAGIYCNASTDSIYATHYYETSDANYKTNIKAINNSNNIPEVREFDWKEDGSHSYGFIAQELEARGYDELVSTDEVGKKTVNYSATLSLVVGKMQKKIEELEQKIMELESKLSKN